jgi:hypothetical protein
MTNSGDLSSFESAVGDVFRKMGLPDPAVMKEIMDNWDGVAGDPWAGRSKPVIVQGDTLIVEASTPSLVAFLRYAKSDLLESLETLLGKGKIEHIEVRPPSRF